MSDTAPSRQLNFRKLCLKLIANGIQAVEVRVGYPKMRKIQGGPELTFVSGDHAVVAHVKRITECDNFEALLDHEDAVAIGGDLGELKDGLLTVIREIFPSEKEKLGVLAIQIEIERVSTDASH